MFPELSAWGYAGGLADDSRPRIARIGTDIRTSKGEMRGSLHCGGKSAAFGRDDEVLCWVRGSGGGDEVVWLATNLRVCDEFSMGMRG